MNTSRTRTVLATPLLLVVLTALSACGGPDGDPSSAATDTGTTSSTPDAATTTGTLALTADGSMAGKCALPTAETLATFDTAFAGTVTSLEGGTATLAVDEWYAGDEVATVTVESPSQDLQDLLLAVEFEEGTSYLVSATGDRVSLCGFTAVKDPELQALYDEAFAG